MGSPVAYTAEKIAAISRAAQGAPLPAAQTDAVLGYVGSETDRATRCMARLLETAVDAVSARRTAYISAAICITIDGYV